MLKIEGYASVFNIEDLAHDTVAPQSFSNLPKKIPMLLSHKPGSVAGYWTKIRVDRIGLFVEGVVSHSLTLKKIKQGMDGLSIGFRPIIFRGVRDQNRLLLDVELVEISLVTSPMNINCRFRKVS
jgi:HK97 family phage prohead protease